MPPIEPFYVELGRLLSATRAKAGLSQQQLGDRLQPPMTRAAIANMETGKQRVLTKTLVELADALGVSVTDLIPPRATRRVTKQPDLGAELKAALNLSADKLKKLTKQLEQRGEDG